MTTIQFDLLGSMRARYWGMRASTTPADSNASGDKNKRGNDFELQGFTISSITFPKLQQTASRGSQESRQDKSHAADMAHASQVSYSHTGLAASRTPGSISYKRDLQHNVTAPAMPTARSDLALSAGAVADRGAPEGAGRGELNTSRATTRLQNADCMGNAAAPPCMTIASLEARSAAVMGKPLVSGMS